MRFKASLLILILLLAALAPVAWAPTELYRPRPEVPGDMAYTTGLVGQWRDLDLFIPASLAGRDVWTGLVFPGVNVDQFEYVAEANLTLYFTLEFTGTASETITIYGYEDHLEAGTFEASAQLIYGPLTSAHVNIPIGSITSGGTYQFDVTEIVRELTEHYWWDPGSSLCFILVSAGETLTRYVSSNEWILAQRPTLSINYGGAPPGGSGEELVERYKDLNIYRVGGGFPLMALYSGATTRIMTWTPSLIFVTNQTRVNNGLMDRFYNSYCVVNGTIHQFVYNQADLDVELHSSPDIGLTWNYILDVDSDTAKDGGSIHYNNKTNTLYFIWSENYNLWISYYNLTTQALTSLGQVFNIGGANYGAQALTTDEEGNIYWIRNGGTSSPASSSYHTYFRKWIRGVGWSSWVKIYDGGTYAFSNPRLYYSKTDNALICVSYRTGQGPHVYYHNLTDADSEWSTPALVGASTWGVMFSMQYQEGAPGRVYTGGQRPDPDSPADLIPAVAWRDYPFTGALTHYGSANFTGQDFSGTQIVKHLNNTIKVLAMRYTAGGAIYYTNPGFYQFKKIAMDWAREEIAGDIETPNLHLGSTQSQLYTTAPFYVVRWDNGTTPPWPCLALARTLEEVKACIDGNRPTDPDDPSPPGWPEEGPFTRFRVQLYLLILGLTMVIGPALFFAYKREAQYIAPALFMIFMGVVLLIYMTYI